MSKEYDRSGSLLRNKDIQKAVVAGIICLSPIAPSKEIESQLTSERITPIIQQQNELTNIDENPKGIIEIFPSGEYLKTVHKANTPETNHRPNEENRTLITVIFSGLLSLFGLTQLLSHMSKEQHPKQKPTNSPNRKARKRY